GMQIGVKNAVVENNYVHHATTEGILITGANVTLQSNDASGNQYYCYEITGYNAENVTLNGNTARDCHTGVYVHGGAANITITSNSFQNTSYRGIYLYDYVYGQVKMTNNNLCASNASDYDVIIDALPSSIIVSGNSCHQNKCYNYYPWKDELKSFCLPEGSRVGNCSTIC
ncbi:MAG: right-handed parallel beta-helix repeat-containing protein, partial [Candidatus Micrarchaeia archaeon]